MPIDYPTPPRPGLTDPNDEDYWQAQSDARTLRDHAAIMADDSRRSGAKYILEKEEAERKAALEELNS